MPNVSTVILSKVFFFFLIFALNEKQKYQISWVQLFSKNAIGMKSLAKESDQLKSGLPYGRVWMRLCEWGVATWSKPFTISPMALGPFAPGEGGYLVERWVRGCAAQIGCFFGLSGFAMAPFLFENWFWYRSRFCKMHISDEFVLWFIYRLSKSTYVSQFTL